MSQQYPLIYIPNSTQVVLVDKTRIPIPGEYHVQYGEQCQVSMCEPRTFAKPDSAYIIGRECPILACKEFLPHAILNSEWVDADEELPKEDGVYEIRNRFSRTNEVENRQYYKGIGFTNYDGYRVHLWNKHTYSKVLRIPEWVWTKQPLPGIEYLEIILNRIEENPDYILQDVVRHVKLAKEEIEAAGGYTREDMIAFGKYLMAENAIFQSCPMEEHFKNFLSLQSKGKPIALELPDGPIQSEDGYIKVTRVIY